MSASTGIAATRERIAARIVGRSAELELLLSAVAAGRDIVLEGPPGTSKTSMLRAITAEWGIPLVLVEGNAELTPAKLIGHHDPSRVLREDFTPENFVPGPLVSAMRDGGFLYIDEFNRAPEDTLGTLLTAISDRSITVPRVGTIAAAPSFRLVASMNPFDNVGTTRLSTSVHDRLCRLAVGYQDATAEAGIVRLRTGAATDGRLGARAVEHSVAAVRLTREHADVRQGSSVRGAIDSALLVGQLADLRGVDDPDDERYPGVLLDALILGLSGRIQLDDVTEATPEAIIHGIWEAVMAFAPATASPG